MTSVVAEREVVGYHGCAFEPRRFRRSSEMHVGSGVVMSCCVLLPGVMAGKVSAASYEDVTVENSVHGATPAGSPFRAGACATTCRVTEVLGEWTEVVTVFLSNVTTCKEHQAYSDSMMNNSRII